MPSFRRIEDKHGVDEPGYEPPRDDPIAEKSSASVDQVQGAPRPPLWRRIVRVVVFILLLAAAWPLFLKNETTVGGASANEIVEGVLLTLIAMAMVGSFGWLIRRIRRSPRTWWQSTFTVPVMLITLVLGAGAHVGREQEQTETATREAAGRSNTTVSAIRAGQDAYVQWMQALIVALPIHIKTAHAVHRLEVVEAEGHPNLQSLQQAFDEGYAAAQEWSRSMKAMPSGDPRLVVVNEELAGAASQEITGWHDYVVGLRTRNFKLAEYGDVVRRRTAPITQRATKAGQALYQQLGGQQAFHGRIDFEHIAELDVAIRNAAKGR
jgi:hypothetical protein